MQNISGPLDAERYGNMLGSLSIWHWVIVGVVVFFLFGRFKFSGMMEDLSKGIKEFRKGMKELDNE